MRTNQQAMTEQEAREKFPHGARKERNGRIFANQSEEAYEAVREIAGGTLVEWVLPLEAPDTTCPRCLGLPGSCSRCHGTGKVPADSILTRIRNGTWDA